MNVNFPHSQILVQTSLLCLHKLRLFGSRYYRVVGLDGLEPSTSRLSGVRSSHLSYKPFSHSQALIQPSSCFPVVSFAGSTHRGLKPRVFAVLPRRWVPTLSGGGDDGVRTHDPLLAGQVLSQLSYTPMFPGSLFQRSLPNHWLGWSVWMDSNHRPHAYQACALTT